MIQVGTNTKLGARIGSFSLPPIITCPGKTDYCAKVCYARRGHFSFPKVQASYTRNLQDSKEDSFVTTVIGEIKRRRITALRLHPSGDFYDKGYIHKWIQIVQASPSVRFWAYTRSWRCPEMVKALQELAALPNMQLLASTDPTTKELAPSWIREATIVKHWEDRPTGFAMCPNQLRKDIKCGTCGICFKPLRCNIAFKAH